MKLKKLLLPLLCLSLMSCNSTTSEDSTPGTSEKGDGDNGSTDSGNTNPDEGKNEPDKTNPDDKNPDQGKTDPDPVDPTPNPDVNSTSWPDDIWNDMKKYLGGEVLPYVELDEPAYMEGTWVGNSSVTAAHDTYYRITTGLEDYESDTISNFKTVYEAAGYEVTADETSATATYQEKHLKVELKRYSSNVYGKYIYLDCHYDEPYDPTSITAWPSDIETEIQAHLDGHDLPFIYLGSTNLIALTPTNNVSWSMRIRADNGSWSDQIITDAKATLSKTAGEWTLSESTDESINSKKLTASKTFSDTCKVTLDITSLYTSIDQMKKGEITIRFEERYNPTGYTLPDSWESTYKDEFDDHDIPAIYLGTKNPTIYSALNTSNYIQIYGNVWNDQIITDAKTTLDASTGWTYVEKTFYEHPGLVAQCRFADGCRIILEIHVSSASDTTPVMYVAYEEKVAQNTDADWSQDVKDLITTNLGTGVTIPYIDLGISNPSAKWSDTKKRLEIQGAATYNSDGALNAITALSDWDITKNDWTYKGLAMEATKKDASGNKYTVSIEPSSYYGIRLCISVDEVFAVPEEGTWPSKILSDMKTNLNGYTLPYIYLGTIRPTSSWFGGDEDDTSTYLTIYGGKWNDQIITQFKNVLNDDMDTLWTLKEGTNSYGKTCVATGENVNTLNKLTVTLKNTYEGIATVKIETKELFKDISNGSWDSTISNKMSTIMDNHVAPYVYLGTTSPTVQSAGKTVTITGGEFDEKVYPIALRNLTAGGFTSEMYSNGYSECVSAYKSFADGCAMRVRVYQQEYGSYDDEDNYEIEGYRAVMMVYYGASYTKSTATAWSSENQTVLDANLGSYKLPYLNMGTTEMTATSTTANKVRLALASGSFSSDSNLTYAVNALETLKKDNSLWDLQLTADSANNGSFTGTLELTDGTITASFSSTSNHTYLDLEYTPKTTAAE